MIKNLKTTQRPRKQLPSSFQIKKKNNRLKNHNEILLKEVKQLKSKVKLLLKLDKETSMDAIESSKSLEVEKQEKPLARDV